RSSELRINLIALSYFRLLRNRDGYNAVRWQDTDKRLARSRRHHPSVAFTPRAIPRRFTRLIGTAEPAGSASPFYPRHSTLLSCKEENVRNRALIETRRKNRHAYRLNYKINSLPYTTIFAQAAGFKTTWELPTTGGLRNIRSVPDVHKCAELVYESHGFDGRSCLLKNICQGLQYARRKDGVIGKILKLLAELYINNGTWHEDPLFCEHHTINCPLQLVGFNSFMES
ncbi:hypothetical protein ALC62_00852, partial [Cyphomyrmex costatus]